MNFRTLVALVALAAFMGSVQAYSMSPILHATESQDIDPRLLDQLVEAVAGSCDLTCCEVREAYAEGRVEVEKMGNGYQVRVLEADGGGLAIVFIEEDL